MKVRLRSQDEFAPCLKQQTTVEVEKVDALQMQYVDIIIAELIKLNV
jgi:hypothetical protein